MKKNYFQLLFILVSFISFSQEIKLTDYVLKPRLDSTYWGKDNNALNKVYSPVANKCQTCVFIQTDTTRGRFCFNTSLGHVRMDTSLHNFSSEKLIGKWEAIYHGLFEIKDSILPDSKICYRNENIINEQKDAKASITFTEKRFISVSKNIRDLPSVNKRFKIINGRFLTVRTLSGYCGATIIGITKDGYLILDDHTYRTLAKKGKYLVITTSIRRTIFKKA